MTLEERFWGALHRQPVSPLTDLSPSLLARGAVEALGLDSGGITLVQPMLRLPLGATDEHSRRAEQLQTTLDDGPCVASARTESIVVADATALRQTWPLYEQQLREHTPFRAVVAIPLWNLERPFGALNLYSTDESLPALPAARDLGAELGDPVAAVLLGALARLETAPRWMRDQDLGERLQVWTAVGMVMEATDTDDRAALDVLRRYARRQGEVLDDVSHALIERRLSAAEVISDS